MNQLHKHTQLYVQNASCISTVSLDTLRGQSIFLYSKEPGQDGKWIICTVKDKEEYVPCYEITVRTPSGFFYDVIVGEEQPWLRQKRTQQIWEQCLTTQLCLGDRIPRACPVSVDIVPEQVNTFHEVFSIEMLYKTHPTIEIINTEAHISTVTVSGNITLGL